MAFGYSTERPIVAQDMITFSVPVSNTVPTPLSQLLDKTKLITTFAISNPVAGSSVYLGNASVTLPAGANPGLEIAAGTSPAFKIFQEARQMYELQALLAVIAEGLECVPPGLEKIPFVAWDLTRLFLISANVAGSLVTVGAWPQMYL